VTTIAVRALAVNFPLVLRGNPSFRTLPERVEEITGLVKQAAGADEPQSFAARALNLTALTASDIGMPERARQLCMQQLAIYQQRAPLTGKQAAYMLEAALNLARLRIRECRGRTAWMMINDMFRALERQTDLVIEGVMLPLAELDDAPVYRSSLLQWAWKTLLVEGLRALLSDGDWGGAYQAAIAHRGIAGHLMEGRQIQIVHTLLDGRVQDAIETLEASQLEAAWENHTASCLLVLCRIANDTPADDEAEAMVEIYLAAAPQTGSEVHHARWGVTALRLAEHTRPDLVSRVIESLADTAIESEDANAARTVLAALAPTSLDTTRTNALTALVEAAWLRRGTFPCELEPDLAEAIVAAQEILAA
jgi:hypothetical protein